MTSRFKMKLEQSQEARAYLENTGWKTHDVRVPHSMNLWSAARRIDMLEPLTKDGQPPRMVIVPKFGAEFNDCRYDLTAGFFFKSRYHKYSALSMTNDDLRKLEPLEQVAKATLEALYKALSQMPDVPMNPTDHPHLMELASLITINGIEAEEAYLQIQEVGKLYGYSISWLNTVVGKVQSVGGYNWPLLNSKAPSGSHVATYDYRILREVMQMVSQRLTLAAS